MPAGGAASPDFIFSRIDPESGPTSSEPMTWPIEETVSRRPPEGAEQAEEDQKPGHVAQQVARLVEPGADRVENAAHGHLRNGHAADAVAEQRRHRRQQHRRLAHFEAGIGDAEAVHPLHFRREARDLAEGEDDADEQHAEDDAVEARIIEEGGPDLPVEHRASAPHNSTKTSMRIRKIRGEDSLMNGSAGWAMPLACYLRSAGTQRPVHGGDYATDARKWNGSRPLSFRRCGSGRADRGG